ncbi:serine hydrolase domain-containing protein [Haliscomenobacter hydrossis]|uniref:Beta-lactamase n=1 Tax=Haliscomenobacter hydrossis (strain ATCC 27775 / DSM 1100 / LMG 10767 / O) TaxID=760192 RepID=F4L5K2_HALH1|nr:serine hydrolase domain-containing protein [Haliscomenobacter hydrossis]AEE51837.1 beta-lactamase [Haliscomenobacter hydrossis DSM 1100]
MYKVIFFSFVTCLWASGQTLAQSEVVKERIDKVENGLIPYVPVQGFPAWNLLDRMKYYQVQGVSIAVINNFKVEWAKGYGWADTLKKEPVSTKTMFSAGSISKFVMAAGAFKLVENQKLSLDAPINNYLKSWKIPANEYTQKTPISLRMLLSHKAGTSQNSYFGFTRDKKPLPTIVDILQGNPIAESRGVVVNSEPNREFRYSGGGSMIAQMAIMDATGENFEAYTMRNIFTPLGMLHSTFAQPLPTKFQKQASWGYSLATWYKGVPYVYPQQAAAGLYSTPTDLAKFIVEIQKAYQSKSSFLKPSSVKEMLTAQAKVSEGGYKEEIGVGPFLIQLSNNQGEKGQYFEFTGVNAGFVAYVIGNFTQGYGAVIMLNSGDDYNGLGKEIRRAIAQTYQWHHFLPDTVKYISLTNSDLAKYEGRYRKGFDEVVYIRREKDYLVERINNGQDIYCFPIAKDTIVFTDYNVKGIFETNVEGKTTSLRTEWQENPMPRMKDDEFAPFELFRDKKYAEAKALLATVKSNEYQITYTAYEALNKPNADLEVVKTLLEIAQEQHPKSSIVYARWGDYYLKMKDTARAIENYEKVLNLDPSDKEAQENLQRLKK